jgi:hypothetical protein
MLFQAEVWAIIAFREKLILLGTAFLAYTLGLRHAVDADHIVAALSGNECKFTPGSEAINRPRPHLLPERNSRKDIRLSK